MTIFTKQNYDEERALYGTKNSKITECSFDGEADGESALKECENIEVDNCYFNLRYPFWHNTNVSITNCNMTENCRAALWYDNNVAIESCQMFGIKALRECNGISIDNCNVKSPEFMWRCSDIRIDNTTINSEYLLFESKNADINNFAMTGKYSFQYVENIKISNSEFNTKDAFWHSKNVTVTDSVVKGEYLGWYSENLKFVRCRIIGTQPLCYCKGLVLEDCTMEETDLSFERSEVNAKVVGRIEGVKNPLCGKITADEIGELLIESEYVNAENSQIICKKIERKLYV